MRADGSTAAKKRTNAADGMRESEVRVKRDKDRDRERVKKSEKRV